MKTLQVDNYGLWGLSQTELLHIDGGKSKPSPDGIDKDSIFYKAGQAVGYVAGEVVGATCIALKYLAEAL